MMERQSRSLMRGEGATSVGSGWQTKLNKFPVFSSGAKWFQSVKPAEGISHSRLPSLMELSLILEQTLFEYGLWHPLNLKDFGSGDHSWQSIFTEQFQSNEEYSQRRVLLLEISLFVYDFNESLIMNDLQRALRLSHAIEDAVKSWHLTGIFPLYLCEIVGEYLTQDFDYAHKDTESGYRARWTDEAKYGRLLSDDTRMMLLRNQGDVIIESSHSEMTTIIRDKPRNHGLFWDFQRYVTGGIKMIFDELKMGHLSRDFHEFTFHPNPYRDTTRVPTPLIRSFEDTGVQFVCLNVLIVRKSDEMWMGVYSMRDFGLIGAWGTNRTPVNGVYYYGGRESAIRRSSAAILDTELSPSQDGCWGNIQHRSGGKLFRKVHLPYYQNGDWVSFRIDTQKKSFDLWLNNTMIVTNVDCSDIHWPWVFVSVVDEESDSLIIEQVIDIDGDICPQCVNGALY